LDVLYVTNGAANCSYLRTGYCSIRGYVDNRLYLLGYIKSEISFCFCNIYLIYTPHFSLMLIWWYSYCFLFYKKKYGKWYMEAWPAHSQLAPSPHMLLPRRDSLICTGSWVVLFFLLRASFSWWRCQKHQAFWFLFTLAYINKKRGSLRRFTYF
jgi:hypothetical protein